MKLVATLLTIGNEYAWLALDPVAPYALAEAKCSLPTSSCLARAKAIHVKLIGEHIDEYWCNVKAEAARLEYEWKENEAHDRAMTAQQEKAERWDRWEMSPPIHTTIINNYGGTYNYFDHPTFVVQECPPPPTRLPGIDAKALATKYRPSPDSELQVNSNGMEVSVALAFISSGIFIVVMAYIICKAAAITFLYLKRYFQRPPPPPPQPQPSPPTSGK